jgi:hypothetical protein
MTEGKTYYERLKEDTERYEKLKEYQREYYKKNKESMKEYQKEYREKTKEKRRENRLLSNKKYYEKNKEKLNEQQKKYRKDNIEKVRKYNREYNKNKRTTNENYRILCNLRTRLTEALKGITKSKRTVELLGCSVEELIEYLEKTKVEGKDYTDAHIDHIRPCASFDLTVPEQQMECFHYTNLQYLPAKENISKGSKYP